MTDLTLVGSAAHILRGLEEAAPALRAAPEERLFSFLLGALAKLGDPAHPAGAALRARAKERSGLSPESIEVALAEALEGIDEAALAALTEALRRQGGVATPVRLSLILLAGNVFLAGLRPALLSLLCRAPTVLKAKSGEDALARGLEEALRESDPELAGAFAAFEASRDDPERLAPLISRADTLSVYGSDRAIAELRARAPATATVIPHGHGLGLAYLPRSLSPSRAEAALEGLARDVAAYDQRGCLSPHALYVEEGGPLTAFEAAERLYAALAALEESRPRGPLPLELGARQLQWRAIAEQRGELLEGDGFAVSEEGEEGFRPSPGYRNVAVHRVRDREAFHAGIAPLGVHLKALGVGGLAAAGVVGAVEAAGVEAQAALAATLPAGLAPRLSALGRMQRPPLGALADGQPPWLGFVRFV